MNRNQHIFALTPKRLDQPGPCPSDPPRCYIDLQRLTTRRSHPFGFAAPSTPFRLSTRTLTFFAEQPSVGFPSDLVPLLALHSPSRTSIAILVRALGIGERPPLPCSRPFSLGLFRPFDAPNLRNPHPGTAYLPQLSPWPSSRTSSRGSVPALFRLCCFPQL